MRKIKKSNRQIKEEKREVKEIEELVEQELDYYFLLGTTVTFATAIIRMFNLELNPHKRVKNLDNEVIDFAHAEFQEVVNRTFGIHHKLNEEEHRLLNCAKLFNSIRLTKEIHVQELKKKYGRYCRSKYKEVEEGFEFIFTFISLYNICFDILKEKSSEFKEKAVLTNIKTILTKIRKHILPWMYYILINNVDPHKKYEDGLAYVNEKYQIS